MPSPAEAGRVRERVLGCPVDVVDLEGAVHILVELVETHRREPGTEPAVVVTLNPEMVMRARRDAAFAAVLESAALLVPDGVGVSRALRRRCHPGAGRVAGIDLLSEYLPHAARLGHRLALAGGRPGVATQAGRELVARHPGLQLVAADPGDPGPALARRLQEARPEMVWAAFGHGRQEAFLDRFLPAIGAAAGIGVGGALDVFAGRVPRAPELVRDSGLEWAWRLGRQPWRVRRQAVLPAFWWLERREAASIHC